MLQSLRRNVLAVVVAVLALTGASADAALLTGTWNNTSFNTSGALSVDLTLTPTTYSAIVDADGMVFGMGDPPAISFSGNIDGGGNAIINEMDHPLFGDVNGTVTAAGVLTASFTDIPAPGIFRMDVQGMATPLAISGTYRVWFADPAQITGDPIEQVHFADGVFSAVPEPASLALLSLGLVALGRRVRR